MSIIVKICDYLKAKDRVMIKPFFSAKCALNTLIISLVLTTSQQLMSMEDSETQLCSLRQDLGMSSTALKHAANQQALAEALAKPNEEELGQIDDILINRPAFHDLTHSLQQLALEDKKGVEFTAALSRAFTHLIYATKKADSFSSQEELQKLESCHREHAAQEGRRAQKMQNALDTLIAQDREREYVVENAQIYQAGMLQLVDDTQALSKKLHREKAKRLAETQFLRDQITNYRRMATEELAKAKEENATLKTQLAAMAGAVKANSFAIAARQNNSSKNSN